MANGMDVSVKDLRTPAFEETFLNNVDDFLKNPNMLNEQGRAALWLASQVYEGTISDEDFNRMSDEILQSPVNQGTPYDKQVSAWISGLNGENIYRNEQEQSSEEEASATQSEEESVTETSSEGVASEGVAEEAAKEAAEEAGESGVVDLNHPFDEDVPAPDVVTFEMSSPDEVLASADSSDTSNPAPDFTDENFVDSYYGELYKNVDKDEFIKYLKETRNADISEEEAFKVFCNMSRLEQEQCVYTKSDLSNVPTQRVDFSHLEAGDSVEYCGGVVTRNEDGTLHVEHEYLGTFDMNEEDFGLGYKTIIEKDGTTSQLPIFMYVREGDAAYEDESGIRHEVMLPEGLKVADYCCENREDLNTMLVWSDNPMGDSALESAHCMYANCSNLKYSPTYNYSYGKHLGEAGASADSAEYPGSEAYFGFPDGLKDLSGFAENCIKLCIQVGDAPKNSCNIRGAFSGCDSMGEHQGPDGWLSCLGWDAEVMAYGGDITPLLSVEFMTDVHEGNYHENVKESDEESAARGSYVDGTVVKENTDSLEEDTEELTDEEKAAKDADGDGEVTPLDEMDKEAADEAKLYSEAENAKKIDDGYVASNTSVKSGGVRTSNFYWDNYKKEKIEDYSGYIKSDYKQDAGWQHVAVDALTGLGIYGGTKLFTKSTVLSLIAGVGGTYFLDKYTNYPESFGPILNFAKKFCKEGGAAYKMLDWWEDKLGISDIGDQQDAMTDLNIASRQVEDGRLQDSFRAMNGSLYMKDFGESLYANAEHCGQNHVFAALGGYWGEDCVGVSESSRLVKDACFAMESNYEGVDPANISDDDKTRLSQFYMRMLDGLEAYNKGGQAGISKCGEEDTSYALLSKEGLGMMNRAYAQPVMESMLAMDEKYHFLTEEQKARIASMDVYGCGNLGEYSAENFEQLRLDSEMSCASLTAAVVAEEEFDATDFNPYHYDDVIDGNMTEDEYDEQQAELAKNNHVLNNFVDVSNESEVTETAAGSSGNGQENAEESENPSESKATTCGLPLDGKFAEDDTNDFEVDIEKE